MNKIYVAGSSKNADFCRHFAALAELQGLKVTHRWWDHLEREDHANCALEDLHGVAECDTLVLILSQFESKGAHLETGFALACRKPVLAVHHRGDHGDDIWLKMPLVTLCQMVDLGLGLTELRQWLQIAKLRWDEWVYHG